MVRQPVVAGQFYPASPSQLKAMIKGLVDEEAVKEEVIGLVSPHAGYVYSGPVAGAVISRTRFKDTFIIMGPNHTGRGEPFSIMTQGEWQTPLGKVEIDSAINMNTPSRFSSRFYNTLRGILSLCLSCSPMLPAPFARKSAGNSPKQLRN